MPTRTYYFPNNFEHIEAILRSESPEQGDDRFAVFRRKGVAPLLTSLDIATVLGIGPSLLLSICLNPAKHYRTFPLTKKDGSERIISAPRTYLKVIQWWILDNILNRIETPDFIFGFSKGKSIHDNARYHAGSTHVLNVDIKSFFDTVTVRQVFAVFKELGYERSTSITLTKLCTLNRSLPQGAPTSPSLANFVLAGMDNRLHALSLDFNVRYSRYADDLTFSSEDYIPQEFLERVNASVKEAGFDLKSTKTRYAGTGGRREITGLVTNAVIQPPVEWRKLNRSRLHRLSHKAELEKADIMYLLGLRGYAMQFPDAVQMLALLNKADTLLRRTRPSALLL